MTQQIGFWLASFLVFATVFFVGWSVIAAVGGNVQRRLRVRLAVLRDESEEGGKPASLIREKYLRQLSPPERLLEELPGMRLLGRLAEQAGYATPAYRVVLASLVLSAFAGLLAIILSGHAPLALLAMAAALPLPLARILVQRKKRLEKFEEQLPDALDMMSRALRAGMPMMESFKFVAEEMAAPIAEEFNTTWSHINYGIEMKASFADLIERVPSVSLRAMMTAILVQRETGGNLAEILDKLAAVLRARFRFYRRLRTLTAEGRMSAIVLIAAPFGLAGMLAVSSPDYLPLLTKDPFGQKLVVGAILLMCLGIFWIRRVIHVRV